MGLMDAFFDSACRYKVIRPGSYYEYVILYHFLALFSHFGTNGKW